MVKIYFANHAQFEGRCTNLGDWAIFEQMIYMLEPYIKRGECSVTVASADQKYTQANYMVKTFPRGGIGGILGTLRAIRESDVIVTGGGEIVQDRSSLFYIPYQLIRPFLGSLLGKKLFGYAIGIGTPDEISSFGRWQARFVLNRFEAITLRDEKSYHVLRKVLHINRPAAYVTADPALNLQATPCERPIYPYYVVSVRSVYHRTGGMLPFSIRRKFGLISRTYKEEIERFKDEIAKLVIQVSEEYGLNPVFLNTYTGKAMSARDDVFTQSVIDRLSPTVREKTSVVPSDLTPSQVKYVLSGATIILSVPLHAMILGASENVPVLGIAYASKNECFLRQIKSEKYVYLAEKLGQRLDCEKIIQDIDNILANRERMVDSLAVQIEKLKSREKMNSSIFLQVCGLKEETNESN